MVVQLSVKRPAMVASAVWVIVSVEELACVSVLHVFASAEGP